MSYAKRSTIQVADAGRRYGNGARNGQVYQMRGGADGESRRRRFVELSHVIEDRMPVFPGLPPPRIQPILTHKQSRVRYQGQAEFYLGQVNMPCNTGTYLDAPFHRYRDGKDLSELDLELIAGLPALVLDAKTNGSNALDFEVSRSETRGKALLVRTGWAANWRRPHYWADGPFLSARTCEAIIRARPALVGVDFCNVDSLSDMSRPAHSMLLRKGIPIVEHLCNLEAVGGRRFHFYAVPPRLRKGASFPVRAFAQFR